MIEWGQRLRRHQRQQLVKDNSAGLLVGYCSCQPGDGEKPGAANKREISAGSWQSVVRFLDQTPYLCAHCIFPCFLEIVTRSHRLSLSVAPEWSFVKR